MKTSTNILFVILSSVLLASCTTSPDRQSNRQPSNNNEVAQLKNQLNQMRREQQILMEENISLKKRYEALIPQIKELSSLLLTGIKNADQETATGSASSAPPVKRDDQKVSSQKNPDNRSNSLKSTPHITSDINNVIIPEGYTFISGGEIISREEWLQANVKKNNEAEIEKIMPTTEGVTYDIRIAAEDREYLEKLSKILMEHGIMDHFIVAHEGSYNLFLGRFKNLKNAAAHSKKINSITGISPEIVKKSMIQKSDAPLR